MSALAGRMRASLRPTAMGVSALVGVMLLWELYAFLGPDNGAVLLGMRVLPRGDERSMPHVWSIIARLGKPETSATDAVPVIWAVAKACWYTLRVAFAGWFVGVAVGMALALVMQRFKAAEAALLPWVVLSQTVPLIALAPLVVGWGGNLAIGSITWQSWMSVAVISAYLAFFPVAVGALRGLQSPDAIHVDLFRSYASSWWATVRKLRLPASVPHLVPALRLGASTAVVGAIVAEVSTGTRGGVGRMIVEYAQSASGDPPKPFTAIIGAAVLGLAAAGLVGLVGRGLSRYHLEVS